MRVGVWSVEDEKKTYVPRARMSKMCENLREVMIAVSRSVLLFKIYTKAIT